MLNVWRKNFVRIGSSVTTSPFLSAPPLPTPGSLATTAFVKLRVGTQDTRNIIEAAVKSLDAIWRPGFRYAKAGIMLSELRPNGVALLNLFDDEVPRAGSDVLMSLMDSMNPLRALQHWIRG
ncbi:hypothetical protein FHW04_004553 [Pantoea sp. AN62]